VLALLATATRQRWPAPRRALACVAAGGLGYLAFTFLFFATLRHASPGIAALLLYFNPFVAFGWSVILGWERFRLGALVTLGVAVGGLALVLNQGSATPMGVGLGVLTAICYGTYLVATSRILRGVPPLTATALICAGAGTVALLGAEIFGAHLPQSTAGWWALAAMTVVSTIIALGLLTVALQRVAPSEVAVIMTLEPITAVTLSAIFLGHPFTAT